jgi:hypothetical protein
MRCSLPLLLLATTASAVKYRSNQDSVLITCSSEVRHELNYYLLCFGHTIIVTFTTASYLIKTTAVNPVLNLFHNSCNAGARRPHLPATVLLICLVD